MKHRDENLARLALNAVDMAGLRVKEVRP